MLKTDQPVYPMIYKKDFRMASKYFYRPIFIIYSYLNIYKTLIDYARKKMATNFKAKFKLFF